MKKNIKILYVDDNPFDRALVYDALVNEHTGYELIEAESKADFEQKIEKHSCDLVLSDFNILGYHGLEVLKTVKEKSPETPVIIVTGTGSEEIAVKAMKLGASDYILKSPSHIRKLPQTIDLVMKHCEKEKKLRETTARLTSSELSFRILSENAFDAIIIFNSKGRLLFANHTAAELSGYSRKELLKMNLKDLVLTSGTSDSNTKTEKRLFNAKLRNKQGNSIDVEITESVIQWHGKRATVNVIRDITERIKHERELLEAKEKAESSDRLKTAFLQTMSHELRTPLNAIIGFADLINEDMSMNEVLDYCNIIKTSGEYLLVMIENVFELSFIISGEAKAVLQPVPVSQIINEINKYFYEELHRQKKEELLFYWNMPKDHKNEIIITDAAKIRKIAEQLLSNALKFTLSGQIEVGYSLNKKEGKNFFRFYVKDTGIGIPKEKQQEAFEIFRQLDDSNTRLFGGMGIGLTLAKGLTELLEGEILLESEQGKGTLVEFTVPVQVTNE